MDFKFRATDGQDSMYRTQSSNYSYFTEQALRAGFPSKFGRTHDVFRNPHDMREAIQRELEKEQIREEIIAAEIARKRVLEAEVRRELMMEREMTALRRSDGFPHMSNNRLEPRLSLLNHQSTGRSLEERIALSLEERYGQYSRREIGGLETVPFQRLSEPKILEIMPLPEDSKEKVIILAKPSINLSGVKRKAVTPPAASASEQLSAGSKKKPKEEWSCAICQVSATSEQGLNEHLMGKKHQSKEAGLRAQRTGGNLGLGVTPKKTAKPMKLAEITVNRSLEKRVMIVRKSPLPKKNSSADGKKNGEPFNADDTEREDGKMEEHKRKKFKFWCEMCQVGAFAEKVMNNHRQGKKHVGRLQELQNGGTAAGAKKAKLASADIAEVETEKEKDLEGVADERETEKEKDVEEVAEERETEKEDLEEVAEEAEEAETVFASEKVEAECQQEVAEVAGNASI